MLRSAFAILVLFASLDSSAQEPDYQKIQAEVQKMMEVEAYPAAVNPLYTREANRGKRWCFVGDTGVDSRSQKQVAKILLQKGNCDRIFHAGDIIYPIGIFSLEDPQLKRKFLNYYSKITTPFYLSIGNHEYYSLRVSPWLDIHTKQKNVRFPYFYYAFNFDEMCVVVGDSTPFDVGDAKWPRAAVQAQWLQTIGGSLGSCKFKVFLAHHPYLSPSKVRKVKQKVVDFYNTYIVGKYDLVVNGHDHVLAYMGKTNGTEFIISGAGGNYASSNDREDFDWKTNPVFGGPGVLYLDINGSTPLTVKATFVMLDGDRFTTPKTVWEKTMVGR